MATEREITLAGRLAIVRRQKWLILLAVVVTTGLALLSSSRQAKLYEATAQVLVNPDASLVQAAGKSASDAQARFDETQAQLAHTPDVASIAVKSADVHGITANGLIAKSSVSSDPSSNILTFSVTNVSPEVAVKLVNAYAKGFTTFGSQVNAQTIQETIDDATRQINVLAARIDAAKKRGAVPAGLRQELNGLVSKRANYEQEKLTALAGARVARNAQSASQTQPDPRKDALLGVILGVVLGFIIAFLREALDTRVRSSAEVAERTGLTLLARIPTPPRALRSKKQLAMLVDTSNASAEAYRKLRVALDFANLEPRARTIMVTSAVEREGKSTTVANLAVALARAGRRVILVDLDLRRPIVGTFFSLENDRRGITDVALGQALLADTLVPIVVPSRRGRSATVGHNGDVTTEGLLHVLPPGSLPPDPAEFLETGALANVLAELGRRADVVLIDAPPLLPVADAATLASRVDAVLLVVKLEALRRPALVELRRLLDSCQAARLGFVLTGAEDDTYGYGYEYGHGYGPSAASQPRDGAAVPARKGT